MTTKTTVSKAAVIESLRAFIAQRSGIQYGNYGERESFMGDYRCILKHGRHARQLLRAVELRDSITADDLIEAAGRAYSGRLAITVRDDGKVAIDYCAGQYFPTEYRSAVCAVLASVLWSYWRADMPKRQLMHNSETGETLERYNGLSAGDWLRRAARHEFGRSIAATWFS